MLSAQLKAQNAINSFQNVGQQLDFTEFDQIVGLDDLSSIVLKVEDQQGAMHYFSVEENNLLEKCVSPVFNQIHTYDLLNIHFPEYAGKLTVGFGNVIVNIETSHGLFQKDNLGFTGAAIPVGHISCKIDGHHNSHYNPLLKSAENLSYGSTLTTYGVVIAMTGEFFEANGNNSLVANTVVANTIDAWNLIYKSELSIAFQLLEVIEFSNANTDPFTGDVIAGLDNRTIQAAEIIDANATVSYEIGHVFHNTSINTADWTDGGIASIEAACKTASVPESGTGPQKAAGWSGAQENTSNAWIQLSAHEIGHMLGATHTFNGIGNACDEYSIDDNTAYEIGSGTTIMAYNGLCDPAQNIPSGGSLDNYFHPVSLDQIRSYSASVACPSNSANTGQVPPTCIGNPSGLTYEIPPGTPFELIGEGIDGNVNDILTYSFEPYDEDGSFIFSQGKIGNAAAVDASAPLFRSIPPSTSPKRIFPALENILAGNNNGVDFEALPLVERTLNFLFVVRDNNPNGGGVCTSPISINVEDFIDQFDIDTQNSPETWMADGTNQETIVWDDTGFEFYFCDSLQLFFSIDEGQSFPYLLADNIPPFSEMIDITVPNIETTEGRLKMGCKNNIWFDINDANITIINNSCDAVGGNITPSEEVVAPQGDASLNLGLTNSYGSIVTNFSGLLETTDNAATLASNNSGSCQNSGNPIVYDEYRLQVDISGSYTFEFDGPNNNRVFNIYSQAFNPDDECEGWLASSADFNGIGINPDDSEVLSLSAETDYYLVVSSFNATLPSLPSAYQIDITGPGDVYSGTIPAPSGVFSYDFLVVNCDNDIIEMLGSSTDLTSFDGGNYKVYGLSYETGTIGSYVGGTFTALTQDIIDFTLCASISDNVVNVTINGPLCDLSDPANDTDGDGICNDYDMCEGQDDNLDSDGDGIPDCVDPCFGFENDSDFDNDGFCLDYDCFDFSASVDLDGDNIPDDCDDFYVWDISYSEISACNNAGTVANAFDDFYTADLTVSFYDDEDPPNLTTGIIRLVQQNPETFVDEVIAQVPLTDLIGTNSYTFSDVQIYLYNQFSSITVQHFESGTPSFINSFGFPLVEECSCQEIFIEILSIECVDVDGTPYDTSDDEIQYTYVATKGTGGMGSSTEGQYGVIEDCQEGEETSSGDCDPDQQTGTFGEEGTVTTSTNAANGGGTRRFLITYDDGCEQEFDFPPFDGECCVPPMFSAQIVCTNPNSNEEAGFDQYFVEVTTTDTGSETGDVIVEVGGSSSIIPGGIGTTYLGPFEFVDGTNIGSIVVGVVGECMVSAEFIEQFCGYTVNAPGGDDLTNDLHENGFFCIEQNGFTEPSIIAQHPGGPSMPEDEVDFNYVYVLTDNTGIILQVNSNGFFTNLDDLTQYSVYADSVLISNLSAVPSIFPIGDPFDLTLCTDCYSISLDILCDQCPLDPNKMEPGICGCGNPEPGTPCDDGIIYSENDMINADCVCEGEYTPVAEIKDPCVCLNNATTDEDGQFSELIQIQSGPDETWSLTNVNSFYQESSPMPPNSPILHTNGTAFDSGLSDGVDNDNDSLIDEFDERFFYTLRGIHIDGIGYSIKASNGIEELNILNKCYYPNFNLSPLVAFEYLPLEISSIVLNGSSNLPAVGAGTYNLYDSNGNLLFSDIDEIPDGLIIGNEYLLEMSFEEDPIIPIPIIGGSATPGCIQQLIIPFKVLSLGCSTDF
ncbi:MAG: reprolysin-like metallopeptidase [Bacteroidota bacterium]